MTSNQSDRHSLRGCRFYTRVFFLTFISTVFLGFFASIFLSKFYWGYFFHPPNLPKKVFEFERILSVTPVFTQRKDSGDLSLTINELKSCDSSLDTGIKVSEPCVTEYCDTERCDSDRILLALSKKGKLPDVTAYISPKRLASIYSYLEGTKLLYEGEPGYDEAKLLKGIVVEAEERNKQRYLFVGVTGGQVSNDHYPYYEFLFHLPSRDARPQLLSVNRLFYDIAGIEGTEWWHVWIFFVVAGFLVSLLIIVAFREIR